MSQHTQQHIQDAHEKTGPFQGLLTKLLHEAFYLEEEFISSHKDNSRERKMSRSEYDFLVSEPDDRQDQISFLQQFLKFRT